MRHKKNKKGEIVVKIDLEKAYDQVDWNFLEKFYGQSVLKNT